MEVEVRYFGHFSNITRKKGETIEVSDASTLKDLLQKLSVKYEVEFRENLFDPDTSEGQTGFLLTGRTFMSCRV